MERVRDMTDKQSQELLPCPFCGGNAYKEPRLVASDRGTIYCETCKGAQAHVTVWNTRVRPAPDESLIRELETLKLKYGYNVLRDIVDDCIATVRQHAPSQNMGDKPLHELADEPMTNFDREASWLETKYRLNSAMQASSFQASADETAGFATRKDASGGACATHNAGAVEDAAVEIKLVKQRFTYDCVAACLAMISGKTIDEVIATVGDLYVEGKGIWREQLALRKLGYAAHTLRKYDVSDWLNPEHFKWLIWGRKAIITVKSLNIEDGFHCIVYDGRRIFDPSLGKTYKDFDEITPVEVVIFQEAALSAAPSPERAARTASPDNAGKVVDLQAKLDAAHHLLNHIHREVCSLEDFDAASLKAEIEQTINGTKIFDDNKALWEENERLKTALNASSGEGK